LSARIKSVESIGESLTKLLKRVGIDQKVCEYDVIYHWPEIVGEQVASVTKALRIVDGVLYVKVKNSTWRNELTFLKSEILTKIAEQNERASVFDIRLI